MKLRIGADYNTMMADSKGRVTVPTWVPSKEYRIDQLEPGLIVTLYDSESLEVDAILEFDPERQYWLAAPDWSTRRDLPPLE